MYAKCVGIYSSPIQRMWATTNVPHLLQMDFLYRYTQLWDVRTVPTKQKWNHQLVGGHLRKPWHEPWNGEWLVYSDPSIGFIKKVAIYKIAGSISSPKKIYSKKIFARSTITPVTGSKRRFQTSPAMFWKAPPLNVEDVPSLAGPSAGSMRIYPPTTGRMGSQDLGGCG